MDDEEREVYKRFLPENRMPPQNILTPDEADILFDVIAGESPTDTRELSEEATTGRRSARTKLLDKISDEKRTGRRQAFSDREIDVIVSVATRVMERDSHETDDEVRSALRKLKKRRTGGRRPGSNRGFREFRRDVKFQG